MYAEAKKNGRFDFSKKDFKMCFKKSFAAIFSCLVCAEICSQKNVFKKTNVWKILENHFFKRANILRVCRKREKLFYNEIYI